MKVIGPRRIAYRDTALLLLITGLTAWVGREAWMDMYSRAITDSENGQALFAPLVAVYLFWVRRSRLQFIGYSPSLSGLAIIVLGYLALQWGIESNTLVVWHLGAIFMMIGGLLTIMGLEFARQFGPALIALLFIIPTRNVRITRRADAGACDRADDDGSRWNRSERHQAGSRDPGRQSTHRCRDR